MRWKTSKFDANQSIARHVPLVMIRLIRPMVRYRLRTLLIVMIAVGVCSAYVGIVLRTHQREQAVLAAIPKLVADSPAKPNPFPVFC